MVTELLTFVLFSSVSQGKAWLQKQRKLPYFVIIFLSKDSSEAEIRLPEDTNPAQKLNSHMKNSFIFSSQKRNRSL